METHIQKWGNSLGLRIPMRIAQKLNLHDGSTVYIDIEENKITIQPQKYDLDSMLEKITPHNQHRQILEDNQKGNEEW
jgi:antitoxin MazE